MILGVNRVCFIISDLSNEVGKDDCIKRGKVCALCRNMTCRVGKLYTGSWQT